MELGEIRYFIIPELYEYLSGLEAKVNGDDNTEPTSNDDSDPTEPTEPADDNDG